MIQKSWHFVAETQNIFLDFYLNEQATKSCDENINDINLISSNIIHNVYQQNTIIIKGNWPNAKMAKVDDE